MRRFRKRQLKYGVVTGVFIFGVHWLIAGLFVPDQPPQGVSNWRASLWLLLGMHFFDIYVQTGAFGGETVSAVDLFNTAPVAELRLLPTAGIALGSFYAARTVSRTSRPKYVLINAASVLAGYLPLLVIAFVMSDINTELKTAVTIISVAAVAIYIGSTLLSYVTGGLPFFGITSLGPILLIGIVVLAVAVEVLRAFAPTLFISASSVGVGATTVYYMRGGDIDDVFSLIRQNISIILPFLLLGIALYIVIGGSTPV